MANNNEDLLKFIGMLVVVGILVFMAAKFLKLQVKVLEGATNMSDAGAASSGEGGNASAYNAKLKASVVKMQDTLLVSKYRADYENILLNLDDYISLLMLKTSLNINLDSEPEAGKPNPNLALLSSIKTLSDAKVSLNTVMKYIDSH
uniref:Uncharacterized protein n=1 Tax=viral metagenome TaxID=1070528 RepID=A0A6C0KTF8_9ZZZZ